MRRLRRASAAKWCNFYAKKIHQQMPLDAKRKVMKYQVCTSTHTATGRDQKANGMIHPPLALKRLSTYAYIDISSRIYLFVIKKIIEKPAGKPPRITCSLKEENLLCVLEFQLQSTLNV